MSLTTEIGLRLLAVVLMVAWIAVIHTVRVRLSAPKIVTKPKRKPLFLAFNQSVRRELLAK